MKRRALMLGVVAFGFLLCEPVSAMADTVIPAGRTVVEVTVVGQDVILNGTSQGSVLVVDGNLTIGPHGHAGHGVTVIGGRITSAPGAQITGDVLQLGGPVPHPSGWTLATLLAAAFALRLLVVWLLMRIARILAAWPTATVMLAATRRRPIRSALVGALLAVGLLAAGLLLALSIIGLILAAAITGVLLLAASLGVGFALRGAHRESRGDTTIFVALAIPLLGDALLALASIVALGAAFHYLVDERDGRTTAVLIDT